MRARIIDARARMVIALDDPGLTALTTTIARLTPWAATASPRHHLLIRRSLTPNAKGEYELAFFYCFVPEHAGSTNAHASAEPQHDRPGHDLRLPY